MDVRGNCMLDCPGAEGHSSHLTKPHTTTYTRLHTHPHRTCMLDWPEQSQTSPKSTSVSSTVSSVRAFSTVICIMRVLVGELSRVCVGGLPTRPSIDRRDLDRRDPSTHPPIHIPTPTHRVRRHRGGLDGHRVEEDRELALRVCRCVVAPRVRWGRRVHARVRDERDELAVARAHAGG